MKKWLVILLICLFALPAMAQWRTFVYFDNDTVWVNGHGYPIKLVDAVTGSITISDTLKLPVLLVDDIYEFTSANGIHIRDNLTTYADVIINQEASEKLVVVSGNDTIAFDPANDLHAISVKINGAEVATIDTTGKEYLASMLGIGIIPTKRFSMSDGTDAYHWDIASDRFTLYNDAGTPIRIFSTDSTGIGYFLSGLAVHGATIDSALSITGGIHASGGLQLDKNAVITGDLAVNGTVNMGDSLKVNNNLKVTEVAAGSTAETIAHFAVSDAGEYVLIRNQTASDVAFAPEIIGSYNGQSYAGLRLTGDTGSSDTAVGAVVELNATKGGLDYTTRPLLSVMNNGTAKVLVEPSGEIIRTSSAKNMRFENVYEAWITHDAATDTITFGVLPANAFVTDVYIWTQEAFNSDGTDEVCVGYDAALEAYAVDVDVATTGVETVTLGATARTVDATSRTLKAYYHTSNATNLTTGEAHVVVKWIQATINP